MAALTSTHIADCLFPYLGSTPTPPQLFDQLSAYLDLLLKWNARTNLTSIRDPEAIVMRHFGESLFLAAHVPAGIQTVLDLGSGAGFPGLPLHLLRPDLSVTLAESQHKKSAFLREAIRSLDLTTQVHAGRAEELMGTQSFDLVALRAVDKMHEALTLARALGAKRLVLTTKAETSRESDIRARHALPSSEDRVLILL